MNIKVGKQAIAEASKKLSNWGRWGKEDQIGTLNHVTPEDIVKAASLIRSGKTFALGIPLDREGPQTGLFGGRFNPIHQMLATGTDAIAGRQDWEQVRSAAPLDAVRARRHPLRVHSATSSMRTKVTTATRPRWSTARGLNVLGIEHSRTRWSAAACCSTSHATAACNGCRTVKAFPMTSFDTMREAAERVDRARRLRHRSHRSDGALPRGEGMGRLCRRRCAPGVKFENCYWCQDKQIAAICTDTWGVEVRPNETTEANQPWHWVVIPAMGLCMG